MTPIDLRRAGPGWTVHFRCGGQATITFRLIKGDARLGFGDGGCELWWNLNGRFALMGEHPLDIIAIDLPPMTEAQMRESLAEIAVIADFIDTQCYTGTVQEKIREILALAKGKS